MSVVRRFTILHIFAALALVLTIAAPVDASVDRGSPPGPSETGRYIVVVDRGANPSEVATDHGVVPAHVYNHALRGFTAGMSQRQATSILRDDRVAFVEAETIERIQQQTVPTGVARIDTDLNPTVTTNGSGTAVDLDIAIIDTGIEAHEDLNVGGGRNFANGGPNNWGDRNGHGTHVAGTVAGKDNGVGVVGVAPGARVWAVRVCGNSGFCMSGDIVAGINWVAAQKSSGGIDFAAANFSISSADSNNSCTSPANATHGAICGLVDTGVPFVMAAGNDNRLKVPYPVAFSVSAIADFDGLPGGLGSPTCRNDTDDSLANFSNYGPQVDIAAPGVCILSTWNNGGYASISGTSMAAPHVTGAVALYLHANGMDPATSRSGADAIKNAIIGAAHPQGTSEANPCSYSDARTGGPLLFVNHSVFGGNGSCGVTEDPPGVVLESIDVTPVDGSIDIAETVQYTATGNYSDGTDADITQEVTWSSSDTTVATIDGSGLATGLAGGSTTITATKDDVAGGTGLTVNTGDEPEVVLESIDVTPVDGSIDIAETVQYTATGNYSDGTDADITQEVTWSSSDTTVATIDGSGLATGLAGGSTTITATKGDTYGATTLTVNPGDEPEAVTVGVAPVVYEQSGRWHLRVLLTVMDADNAVVEGAMVAMTLHGGDTVIGSASGTTGGDGTVTFQFNHVLRNHPDATFTTHVDDVSGDGIEWDEEQPVDDGFAVGSTRQGGYAIV